MKYNATIKFDTTSNHPDAQNAKGLEYSDVYKIDPGAFYGHESIIDYIQEDLSLVAGGGYNSKHITNVTFKIVEG